MRVTALGLLLLAISPACFRTKEVRYYTLASESLRAQARPGIADYTVHVGPVSVPETLDRSEIVVRLSPTEVAIDDGQRWAEPLRNGIARTVADSLGRELDGALVSASDTGTSRATHDVEV